jgi:hypothetical protein
MFARLRRLRVRILTGRRTEPLQRDLRSWRFRRVPFTQSNITVAGSIGAKDKATDALPSYGKGRLAGNENFVNNSTTLTIGPAEGVGLLVIGKQDGAPAIDLYLVIR